MICFPILPIFFSLLLATTEGITHPKKVAATPINRTATDICHPVGQLVSNQGGVQLKRSGWTEYHSTDIGVTLCQGDLLRLTRGAKAIVQCSDPDQTLWTVPDGMSSSVDHKCYLPNEKIYRINGPINPTRDPLARNIPYIITPSHTWLLNKQPLLRWTAVRGATNYVVRVSGPGVDWIEEVTQTQIVYPGKQPLQPVEEGYLITVEADNGETAAKTTFGLLTPQKAARVRAAAARIKQQNLSPDAKVLALSQLYIGQELIAEATELLEAAVARGSTTAAIHRTLGELYAQIELFEPARKELIKAVELSTAAKDTEGMATAAAKLAQVYEILGDSKKATYWLQHSQRKYQSLLSLKPVTD